MEPIRPNGIFLASGLAIVFFVVMSATTLLASAPSEAADAINLEIAERAGPADLEINADLSNNNCRYGLAALGEEQVALVDDFQSGLFLDFSYRSWEEETSQYMPFITVKEDKNGATYLGTYSTYPSIESTSPNSTSSLRYWLQRHPGQLWVIGNEVERGPDPGQVTSSQGDVHAEVYAKAYHDVRQYIKKYDPTARTAISGLVQVTPIRLAYLDAVWDSHVAIFGNPPEVDAWTMHIYILPEVNPNGEPNAIASIPVGLESLIGLAKKESGGLPTQCPLGEVYCFAEHDNMTIFAQQVVDMRQWMKAHRQQNRPLLLTEYSLLYPYEQDPTSCFIQDEYGNCFTPARVQAFMNASLDYLENASDMNLGYPFDGGRLVQQWIWFSINNGTSAGSVSNLYEGGLATIRPLGQLYKDRISAVPTLINLRTDRAGMIFADSGGTGTADVDIWATFRNNGNTHIDEPFAVTFYKNASLTNAIGSATVTPDPLVVGCSQIDYRASVVWQDVEPGVHKYWAKVDSGNVLGESNEGDNMIQGIVFVDGDYLFLPLAFYR